MILKDRIIAALPAHQAYFASKDSVVLYVRDMKRINGGTATIDSNSSGVPAVELKNPFQIVVDFDAFPDNALPLGVGIYQKQCECVLFPEGADVDEWVLFIETKYVNNLSNAQKQEYGYPQLMVTQIKKTVEYFRANNIIPPDKRVKAIISYPTLEEGFESWCFPIEYSDGTTETVEDILLKDKIHIRATNCAIIKSVKRLYLGERK